MAVVGGLLGRPGSGKSLAAQYIKTLLSPKTGGSLKLEPLYTRSTVAQNWQVEHITDYSFLLDMFLSEGEATGRFKATEHGGFDVVDFSVLNTALEMVKEKVCRQLGDQHKLILVEFARDNYSDIQQIFKEIYSDTHFLYFEANIETCIRRVKTRVQRRETINDNFVSEEIMRKYYSTDCSEAWLESQNDKFEIIQNDGTWEEFGDKIQKFLKNLLRELESETEPESALFSPALASLIV